MTDDNLEVVVVVVVVTDENGLDFSPMLGNLKYTLETFLLCMKNLKLVIGPDMNKKRIQQYKEVLHNFTQQRMNSKILHFEVPSSNIVKLQAENNAYHRMTSHSMFTYYFSQLQLHGKQCLVTQRF